MKKKSASRSAFFNLRVLIGLCIALVGVVLMLAQIGTFSVTAASSAQAQQKFHTIDIPGLPPGFDCATIYEKGIHKQENFRAGLIMRACGEGGSEVDSETSGGIRFSRLMNNMLSQPLFIGGNDVDVILPDGTFPKVTQSESMEWCGPNNTCVVNYNDSRTSPGCYSGLSYSTDNGATWHAGQPLCTGHGTNFGDPIVVYNAALNMWFAGDLATGCGGQGIGLWTSPNGITWTPGACAHSGGSDDRQSMWVDNHPSSPRFGRMYISWNNFAVGGGALQVVYSDNGTTWTGPVTLNGSFIRDIQVTGDLQGSGRVYVASMNEMGGGLSTRQNTMYRSTDGGATWASSTTGPAFPAVGRSACSANSYFVCMFGTNNWRHMGWGQPAANGNFVSLNYAQHGTGADLGDVYYVRSTDQGVTWGTPLKLNTDTGTALQWQPSLTASNTGGLFASWYDQREVNGGADLNCTAGNAAQNCYRRWGRLSFDNGATWQADDMVGHALSPLPAQPDSAVQPNYQGDYDYHSSFGNMTIGGWTDGRVIISGQSQQDVFVNLVTLGFGVTSTVPACNSVINTQPVDFVVNLSDAVDTATVQAGDFMVNGIASNLAPTFQNGNQTIVFHYSTTPVTTEGPQTMHIPANAFNRASDNMGNVEFMCDFCYALMPLQVTTTVPPVGGTFSPPAPGDYNFDVNFSQAVDTASVQDTDLTITGAGVGGSVTGHSFLNGNQTVRFNLHFNFGGSVTLSIAAGAMTAGGCNTNAAFTGMYTVSGCPPAGYTTATGMGTITPGGTDSGNHCDDCITQVNLPFPVNVYGAPTSVAYVGSNGDVQLTNTPGDKLFYWQQCVPVNPDQGGPFVNALFPYYDDLRTDELAVCPDCGVFTQTVGSSPNRQFIMRWKTTYFNHTGTAEFEVLLTEGSDTLSAIYGASNNNGAEATSGIQQDLTHFTSFSCFQNVLTPSLRVDYIPPSCASPTPTPTASPTATATATATATPTPTATATATATATVSPTATPAPTVRPTPTPRSRPTPVPRP